MLPSIGQPAWKLTSETPRRFFIAQVGIGRLERVIRQMVIGRTWLTCVGNVILVPTAWKMPAPRGTATEEDFLTGAHRHQHQHLGRHIFPPFQSFPACHCGRQELSGLFGPRYHNALSQIYFPNHTASHHLKWEPLKPQTSPSPLFQEMPSRRWELFWSNQGKTIWKWFPVNMRAQHGWNRVRSGLCRSGPILVKAINQIRIIYQRQVIMMELKWSGCGPEAWGLMCPSERRQPWVEQTSSFSTCQTHWQNTLQQVQSSL